MSPRACAMVSGVYYAAMKVCAKIGAVLGTIAVTVAVLAGCGANDAPLQAEDRPLGLPLLAPVKASGSDWAAWRFNRSYLREFVDTASATFNAENLKTRFAEYALDPSALQLAEETEVRVYFVGEASGYRNALGINLSGVGIREGKAELLFPSAETQITLYEWARRKGSPARADRTAATPLVPGDFVDLGTLPAGTHLEFLLIANDTRGNIYPYTAHDSRNPDRQRHVVAVAVPDSPFLLLSFEDMYGGGDSDYSDCVFAVQVSDYNVQALLGNIDPMREIKRVVAFAVPLALLVVVPLLYLAIRQLLRLRRLRRARREAKAALESGDSARAAEIVREVRQRESNARGLRPLVSIEVQARQRLRDTTGLLNLFDKFPEAFDRHEKASLAVGRQQIGLGNPEGFSALRDRWRQREKDRGAWLGLDIDALLLQGNEAAARELIGSAPEELTNTGPLLARQGAILVREDPAKAQSLFRSAHRISPDDPEVWRLHGEACDRTGGLDEALNAYQHALAMVPGDPMTRDLFANAYRKTGELDKAMAVWAAGLKPPSTPIMWLRFLFWQRVLQPHNEDLSKYPEPEGALMPLVNYLRNLPDGAFWDQSAFERMARRHPGVAERQEVFWLKLCNALRKQREDAAFSLLNLSSYGETSWAPDLEAALLRILTWRRTGFMSSTGVPPRRKAHHFFKDLYARACGAEESGLSGLDAVLQSPNVFAAAFLAAEWRVAGIWVRANSKVDGMPPWYGQCVLDAAQHVRKKDA